MILHEERLGGRLQGTAVRPHSPCGVGVVVLAGSSGRVDVERARLFGQRGAMAVALRWFGGPDQSPGICEIPLETFTAAVDWLVYQGVRQVGIIGSSKGAEGALFVACRDTRVRAVVAISPSSVAWANVGPGRDGQMHPYRSSWTWRGHPLPFVSYDESWTAPQSTSPIAYRSLYEQSMQAFPSAMSAAAVPIEDASADVLLIAGGADAMWPSETFAATLAVRRRQAKRQVEVIDHPEAGHAPYFPSEYARTSTPHVMHGGSDAADAALGYVAWPRVLALFDLLQ